MKPEGRSSAVGRVRDQFPVGMRVLAVDDDPVCLKVLDTLLRRCQYHVTTTNQAVIALKMLRENREMFDLVISDVHMPDMDGFKLLELVGLEMDLPVIMLSVNGETKTVMKGITHGACDYLLKPVRIEELRNIWQHVIRRKFSNRDRPNVDTYEECNKPPNADQSQITCGSPDQSGRPSKKRKEYHSEEDDDEGDENNGQENDDPSAPKKPRVVWSVELHRKFVAAVNHLGIDKAVPKRILELMNVEKLTRENVASHLQKYRLYLKRLSVVASQQASIVAALGGSDSFMRMGAFEGLQGYQTFTSSAALSSYSPQGLLSTSNPASFGVQGMTASRSIQIANSNSTISHPIRDTKYHPSLPGNRQGNLAHSLTTSVGQVQLPQKWINEETDDLSNIISGNGLTNGALECVTKSSLLEQEFVEGREAKAVIQPLIKTSGILEHPGGTVGVSSSLMDSRVSQQSCLPLPAFSASGLPMNGSSGDKIGKLGSASSGGTLICSSNDLRVARDNKVGASFFCSTILLAPGGEQNLKYLNFGNVSSLRQNVDAENLLDSKLVWSSLSSSQQLSNLGAHHPVSQRLNNGLGGGMIGQASASSSTAAPQTKVDTFISGDVLLPPKNASDFSIPKLHSELSSSSCSFDGLLNSIIKVEKDDASFSDDMGCDFYSLGACI